MKLIIRTVPDPILRNKAKRVSQVDKKLIELIKEMITLVKQKEGKKARGVGLAAPQVGYSIQLIVVWSTGSRKLIPMINPQIIWQSKRTRRGLPNKKSPYEGCLSVPGWLAIVRRYSVIKVRYQTINQQTVIRKFRDLTGVIIQHEVDHLNGILFTDRAQEQQEKLIKIENIK